MIIRHFFSFVFLFYWIAISAQSSDQSIITGKFQSFINLTNEKDFSAAFDLMYPKMFTFVSKQELVDLMASADQDGLSILIQNPEITSFSDPLKDGNETFIKFEFTSDIHVNILPGGLYDSPKASQAIMEQFQYAYGKENVRWRQESNSYSIDAKKSMMAIRAENGEWYLVEINPDQAELMKALFSEKVLNAFVNK